MSQRQTFLVTLESDGDPHAARFLARWLKACWRSYRLKCVDLREVKADVRPPKGVAITYTLDDISNRG